MKRIRRRAAALAAGLGACLFLCGCTVGDTEIRLDTGEITAFGGIFAINGEKCSTTEAKLYLANYINLYGSSYGIDLSGFDFGDMTLEKYSKEVALEELSRIYLMDQLAEKEQISLDESEQALVEQAAGAYYASLSEQERSFLEIAESDLVQYYENYALAQKLFTVMCSSTQGQVSEDDARVMKAQAIMVTDEAKAAEVTSSLAAGKDFAVVAATCNELAKTDVTITRETYNDTINAVIYAMENNEVSGPIRTEEGIYFFRITDKYVTDLTAANKEHLKEEIETKAFREAYEDFVENSLFKLNEDEWDTLTCEGTLQNAEFFTIYDRVFNQEK